MKKIKVFTSRKVVCLSFHEILLIAIVIAAALCTRLLFLELRPFQSDESIYVYSAYAITKGIVPYREIFLAHPPLMYLIYAVFIQSVGPNYIYLRLCTVGIYLITILLTYLMTKAFIKNRKLGLICATVYAFFPSYYLLLSVKGLLENLLTLFTLSSFVVYIAFHNHRKRKLLFLMGVLMGLAVITTFRAAFFIASVILFHLIISKWSKKFRSAVVDVSVISLGVTLPLFLALVWITFHLRGFSQFYIQTYYYQTIRFPIGLSRLSNQLYTYALVFSPLLITGLLGAYFLVRMAKREGNLLLVLPAWIYGFVFTTLVLLLPRPFFHHLFYLSPYLTLLSLMGIVRLGQLLSRANDKIKNSFNKTIVISSVLLVLLVVSQIYYAVPIVLPYFRESPYEEVHSYIGNYIEKITNPSDRIWTSEGAIAIFAQRLILSPNSTDFPFQPCFSTVFSFYFEEDIGNKMKAYKSGFLTTDQFIEAWEKEEVKVVIFIKGNGWIPYPDELLWKGPRDQEGVSMYIQENYELELNYTSPEVPYEYNVWVRR